MGRPGWSQADRARLDRRRKTEPDGHRLPTPASQIARPVLHEPTPALEQVRPPIRRLAPPRRRVHEELEGQQATGFASEARSFLSAEATSRCGNARMCRTTASCGQRTPDTTRSRRSPPAPAFTVPSGSRPEPSWPPSLDSLPSCRGSHNSGGSVRCKNDRDPRWYRNHLNGGVPVGRADWSPVGPPTLGARIQDTERNQWAETATLGAKSSPAWITACCIGS